jgi:hypothetical protein
VTPIVRACRSCVSCPDSYEVDCVGRCISCSDTKVEHVDECDGCGDATDDLGVYEVEFHDGGSDDEVIYCGDCAGLARMDWNGETKSIKPQTNRGAVPC